MNPYAGAGFFQFFAVLAERIWLFVTGGGVAMASDEVQLAVLSCCAIACGIVGPFLSLKKMTMFANGLSHTSLLGIACAYLLVTRAWGGELTDLSTLLVGALLAALLTAGMTEGFVRFFRLPEDASIGLVFTSLFALGVVLVSLTSMRSKSPICASQEPLRLQTQRPFFSFTGNCNFSPLTNRFFERSASLFPSGSTFSSS
jgi:manganese/zinc/iron transport system permease protein